MKSMIIAAALAFAGGALFAQAPLVVNVEAQGAQPSQGGLVYASQELTLPESPDLEAFKKKMMAAYPDMNLVGIQGDVRAVMAPKPPPPPKKTPVMAIFVKNNTRVEGMNDEVDGIRDRLAAELAGMDFIIMDSAEIGAAFFQSKIPAEEQDKMIDLLFRGGSVTRVAQTLGADYVLLASINGASQMNRFAGDRGVTTYTLRMATKVLDASTGGSVFGRNWTNKRPTPQGNGDDPMNLYNDLIDMWVADTGADLASSSQSWREAVRDTALATFTVTTTLDAYIQPLQASVDATREVKDELRVVAGGITVEIDGAAVGSSGGTFQARPGLHQMRVTRQWMQPWVKTVNIQNGAVFNVALELSDEGFRHYSNKEMLRAELALRYAEAAYRKGCRVNFDTSAWQTVTWAPNPAATSVSTSTLVQPPLELPQQFVQPIVQPAVQPAQ